jgi:hypothetical protein
MLLDPLINAIYWPINLVRRYVFGIQSIKGGFRGDLMRVRGAGTQVKQELMRGVGGVKQLGQRAHNGQNEAAGTADAASGGAMVVAKPKRRLMGWFSRKKKCGQCGQKLHPTWDQCPFCGAGGAQVAAPQSGGGGKQRTVALDAIGGGKSATLGWLVPLEGPQVGELFQLKGKAVVGTATDCDVVLKDVSISGRHAEFVAQGRGFKVTDLGSTNGTFVNDKRVTQSDLVDNDNVRLGKTNFKFKSID